jgi:ubiquinone biosynthesis protein
MGLIKTISSLPQVRKNAQRFHEIVSVFARYGLGSWLHGGSPKFLQMRVKSAEGVPLADLTKAECARLALTELGTTFIKLGQLLSTRADLVGPEFAAEMSKLQSSTPPDPAGVVKQVIEDELRQSVEQAFPTFDSEPLGSASIGQVHRAELDDGTRVVVKVQHAGIEDKVRTDLEILTVLADQVEKHSPELARYSPGRTAREFAHSLLAELDYSIERSNLETFVENFKDDDTVRFPAPTSRLSAGRVLTMELLDGTPIDRVDQLLKDGVDPKLVAQRGAGAWINMILRDGFYHADPHPGNILVRKDGTLSILDCGMVGRLDTATLEQFEDVVIALLTGEADEVSRAILSICGKPPALDRAAFSADVAQFCTAYLTRDMSDLDFGAVALAATELIRRHGLVLPAQIAQLLKTLVMLEGTSRTLDRSFNMIELIAPYKMKIIKRRLSPQYLVKRAVSTVRDYERLVRSFPREAIEILERASAGTFEVQLRHRDLEVVTSRLVHGLVFTAVFIGSTLLVVNQTPPLLGGLSLLGIVGFVTSVYLGWRALKKQPRT